MATDIVALPDDYAELLKAVKERIQGAQTRAALVVNRELVLLCWSIGREIVVRQQDQRRGAGVIEALAKDLQAAFPGEGFSARNLWRMRAFHLAYRPKGRFCHRLWQNSRRRRRSRGELTNGATYPLKSLQERYIAVQLHIQ